MVKKQSIYLIGSFRSEVQKSLTCMSVQGTNQKRRINEINLIKLSVSGTTENRRITERKSIKETTYK